MLGLAASRDKAWGITPVLCSFPRKTNNG